MFVGFFDRLRANGLHVTTGQWVELCRALDGRAIPEELRSFYELGRAWICKDETDFGKYDRAFAAYFKELVPEGDILDTIVNNMAADKDPLEVTDALKAELEALSLQEVLDNFYEQLREKHYNEHQGGNKAIGKYGRSTQGAYGYNPAGVRIGQESGRHGRAIQIAEWRKFKNYDGSQTLGTRDLQVALKLLKKALPVGPYDELNIEKSIDASARNAGEIELVFDQRRKPTAKVVLMLDVGGSMDPFAHTVNTLFSAAKTQLKDLQVYYFHNCMYQEVWEDAAREQAVPLNHIVEKYAKDHWLICVGDASMSPYELMHKDGAIDLWYRNERPGIEWLQMLQSSFLRSIWLNPEPQRSWEWTYTIQEIRGVFRMLPLTLDGLKEGVEYLRKQQAVQ